MNVQPFLIGEDKKCVKCGAVKSIDEFPKDRTRKDGAFPWCKACKRSHDHQTYIENGEQIRARSALRFEMKRGEILEYRHQHYGERKDKYNLARRIKYATNPAYFIERTRQYVCEHPEENRIYHAGWRKNNGPALLSYRRAHRAKMVGGYVSVSEWNAILKLYGGRCLRCGTTKDITADHVIPLAKGGPHNASNIQPLCRPCNSWKGVKIIDFRQRMRMSA